MRDWLERKKESALNNSIGRADIKNSHHHWASV